MKRHKKKKHKRPRHVDLRDACTTMFSRIMCGGRQGRWRRDVCQQRDLKIR